MSEIDLEVLGIFVDEALDALVEWERSCLNLEQNPSENDLNALFRAAHNIKGASKAVGLDKLGTFVHQIENLITIVQKGKLGINKDICALFLKGQEMLNNWITELKKDPYFTMNTSEYCAQLNKALDGANAEQTQDLGSAAQAHIQPEENLLEGVEEKKVSSTKANQSRANETIRISADKLGELIQLIGELSIHQSIVNHGSTTKSLDSERCTKAISLMSKVIKDIQSRAMALRMQPLQGTFQRLERVAKDVARDLNKEIIVSVDGGDVDLDKTVTERMIDPMIHIVRNAVDHGIEEPEDREKNGKPRQARLRISAEQDANGVLITVRDDGRGMDLDRILKKAIEKKLAVSGDGLTKKDILNFIFKAGFSTAAKVTAISGRGVGLDVVRGVVDQLGGFVEVDSDFGKGSIFKISLPTSLAILEAIIVGVSDNRYVVPLRDVNEIIDLNSYPRENTAKGGQMLSLRGNVVPIEALSKYLPAKSNSMGKENKNVLATNTFSHLKPALITVVENKRLAFQVDSIIAQQQVVMRDLSENLSRIPGLIGGTILADGEPGMIIGLDTIGRAFLKASGMTESAA
jgi:two-component system, chemotaxis family, sensor kinase CheA